LKFARIIAAIFSMMPVLVFSPVAALAQTTAQPASAASQQADPSAADPVGNVATLQGRADVTRQGVTSPLKMRDDIFKNDLLHTEINGTLGVTFNDDTTLNLRSNSSVSIDNYIYEDGGKNNAALLNIALGTVAFVASAVARTGDMKIATPTATLGIRGTTGLVEVPAAGSSGSVGIKLYPDQDGRVGHIEVNGRDGTRLGLLSEGATGFAIRPGAGGRFSAVPLQISPQEAVRDRAIVQQVHAAQTVGHQVVAQQRVLRQQRNPQSRPGQQNQPARQNSQPQNARPQNARPGLPGRQPNAPNPAAPQNQRTPSPEQPEQRNPNAPNNGPKPLLQRPGQRNPLGLPPKRAPKNPEGGKRGKRPE
jgi:hypothetical protein